MRRLACLAVLAAAPGGEAIYYGVPGIHAEYFTLLPWSCDALNGSITALDGLLPNIVRKVSSLNFAEGRDFGLDECFFERGPMGTRGKSCRNAGALRNNFAARYSGFIGVQEEGMYEFEMESDDGARLTIGHGKCPGLSCGTQYQVTNLRFGDLERSNRKDDTYVRHCLECQSGIYENCFVTDSGCEPFAMWQLEADNGRNGSCKTGLHTTTGSRFLQVGKHPFKVEYFQRGGAAKFVLRWKGPDSNNAMSPMSGSAFVYPEENGLYTEWYKLNDLPTNLPPASTYGSMYDGARLLQRGTDLMLDMEQGTSQFSTNLAAIGGAVLVRWMGFLNIAIEGEYRFHLRSDDGSRLVMGGRGMDGEEVVVDNDGIKGQLVSKEATRKMLAGKTAIRIEYLYSPGAPGPYGDTGIPKPPGIEIYYTGPDTKDAEEPLSRARGVALSPNDIECETRLWQAGGGLTNSRDCNGKCYDSSEALIGDRICDNGILGDMNFLCPTFDMDQGDCNVVPPVEVTTPRPANPCLVTCPTGNFSRRDCSLCDVQAEGGDMCLEEQVKDCVRGPDDPPGWCNFGRCCVAQVLNDDYWGTDCIAFGSWDDCEGDMKRILKEMDSAPRSLPMIGSAPKRGRHRGKLMVDCEGDQCNTIPDDKMRNPYTGRLTDELICQVGEATRTGQECFVGPWPETDPSPLDSCERNEQRGSFKWNFCLNRKSVLGRPFERCCSFLWVDSRGQPVCHMVGVERGTCEQYLAAYKASVRGDAFRAIDMELVLNDCERDEGDQCNDPMEPELGCPDSVIQRPWQVSHIVPEEIDMAKLMSEGGKAKSEGIPWLLIMIPFCALGIMVASAYGAYVMYKEPQHSPWHSDKAKIVNAEDTFVEPQQDLDPKIIGTVLDGVPYGVVHPRPRALQQLLREQRNERSAKGVRVHPALMPQEVVELAQAAMAETEAEIRGISPEEYLAEAEADGVPSPISQQARRAAAEAFMLHVPPPATKKSAAALHEEMCEQMDLDPGAAAAATMKSLGLGDASDAALMDDTRMQQLAIPGQVADGEGMLPPPPADSNERLVRAAAQMAAHQALTMPAAAPGAVTIVEALRASATVGAVQQAVPVPAPGRPAAVAKSMRSGGKGGGKGAKMVVT